MTNKRCWKIESSNQNEEMDVVRGKKKGLEDILRVSSKVRG